MLELLPIIDFDGTLHYLEKYDKENTLENLIEGILWRNDTITMFGKTHPQPRKTAWYGDEIFITLIQV